MRESGSVLQAAIALLVGAALIGGSSVFAQIRSDDDSLQTRRVVTAEEVNAIAGKLMAPCCWSETADMHQSQAAAEVREQIRRALELGYDEKQILAAFEQAYGERILARPKARGFNLLVWTLPPAALVISLVWAARFLRKLEKPAKQLAGSPRRKKAGAKMSEYESRIEDELRALD